MAFVFWAGYMTRQWQYSPPLVQTKVVVDSVPFEVPVEIIQEKAIIKSVPQEIDSLEVALAYYSEHPFRFKGDTNQVTVEGKGLVRENQIVSLDLNVTNHRPLQIRQEAPQNAIHLGAIAGSGLVTPLLEYERKNWSLGVGYNLYSESPSRLILSYKHNLKSW